MRRSLPLIWLPWLVLTLGLAACSTGSVVVEPDDPAHGHLAPEAWQPTAQRLLTTPPSALGWQSFALPGKRHVPFETVVVLDRTALRVKADNSVSILRRRFEPTLGKPGRFAFSWKVDALPAGADLSAADASDSPVGVVLAFEGDRTRWSARTHRLSEMSRLLTGEELPFATLIYVWGSHELPGTVVVNPRTDRIRKLVLDSGTRDIGVWRDHVRDVQADFRQVFGEEPGPLRVVALMTDTDNTRSALTAWYGALNLEVAAAVP
ncbi:MAG: DUF3047 domain-containing protein [Hydrogenophaga sp.]|uniref:DUF3047 domain-containing protein n=1 Tax=Hydrogenophaga sp. TaxID=1904254 RepID=UPI0026195078|nr:DUF3047 domain-containing protein [Hydrogenophaga sp.]MDM7941049.1 DUF3047 domain-containing protein [Hydrogenophaga sp.]